MDDDAVEMPITGELDLHTFRPQDVADVVEEYLLTCRERGVLQVRIVHGKGIGTLRESVHRKLKTLPWVRAFRPGDETSGGWGATRVTLLPADH